MLSLKCTKEPVAPSCDALIRRMEMLKRIECMTRIKLT